MTGRDEYLSLDIEHDLYLISVSVPLKKKRLFARDSTGRKKKFLFFVKLKNKKSQGSFVSIDVCVEKEVLSDKTWITICTCIICYFVSIDINRVYFRSTTFINNFTFRSNFIRLNGFFKKLIECFRYRSIRTTILNEQFSPRNSFVHYLTNLRFFTMRIHSFRG